MRANAAEGQHADDVRFLPEIAAVLRANLPLLLALDTVLLLAAVPAVVLVAAGTPILAPLAAALTLGPLWAATIATADHLWHGEDATFGTFLGMVRRFGVRGAAISLLPAGLATLLLGTLRILADHPREHWMLLPLFADGSAASLALLACGTAFSLGTTGRLRGRALWRASLGVVATSPLHTLATVAIVVLGGVAVDVFGPLVPALLVAPFAVYLSASTWRYADRVPSASGQRVGAAHASPDQTR